MGNIKAYTIKTTTRGETVYPNIILNGGNIAVNQHRLPMTEDLFGSMDISISRQSKGDIQYLLELERTLLPKAFPSHLSWMEEQYLNNEWTVKNDFYEPISAIVLLTSSCKTNLRCPLPNTYWGKWVEAENLRNEQTPIIKEELKQVYSKDYDIRNSGAFIILPDSPLSINRKEYLILMANNGAIEWVFNRTDGRPNTYRIECKEGNVVLIDPRRESSMMMEEEKDDARRDDF